MISNTEHQARLSRNISDNKINKYLNDLKSQMLDHKIKKLK